MELVDIFFYSAGFISNLDEKKRVIQDEIERLEDAYDDAKYPDAVIEASR